MVKQQAIVLHANQHLFDVCLLTDCYHGKSAMLAGMETPPLDSVRFPAFPAFSTR